MSHDPNDEKETWVLVAGTRHEPLPKVQQLAAEAVGRQLAHHGFGLVTCGWRGVDKAVTRAFAGELQALGLPLSRRLKQIVPRPDEPAFFGGDVIYVEKGVPEWVESVRRAQAVILIGGIEGTLKTYETAVVEHVPVFPLPGTGGNAQTAFADILENIGQAKRFHHVGQSQLESLDAPMTNHDTIEDVVARLFDLLSEEVSGRAARPAEPRRSSKPKEKRSKKSERVDFLLVTALPEERDALLGQLPDYVRVPPQRDDIYVYFSADVATTDGAGFYRTVVMPLLGMGRVNAATATADAIKRWRPRHVIVVGVAGGIAARNVGLGDLLISEQVVDYELQKITTNGIEVRWSVHKASRRLYAAALNVIGDAWTQRITEKKPSEGLPRIHVGPIASGDKVVAVQSVLDEYRNVWPALVGVEMEAAGVASACFSAATQPEFFMVRGVSDLADEMKNAPGTEGFRGYACDVAAAYVVELIRNRPVPFLKRG
ncbi:MAG TPA: 5'-methylthioadenosine/S-adenosylhomocysteine nucleosidase [Polyangium sp.]|nr:5'-methylthioadenosine/S-adenosylhomocysteine nucleosidase [Polyangium sp.]